MLRVQSAQTLQGIRGYGRANDNEQDTAFDIQDSAEASRSSSTTKSRGVMQLNVSANNNAAKIFPNAHANTKHGAL